MTWRVTVDYRTRDWRLQWPTASRRPFCWPTPYTVLLANAHNTPRSFHSLVWAAFNLSCLFSDATRYVFGLERGCCLAVYGRRSYTFDRILDPTQQPGVLSCLFVLHTVTVDGVEGAGRWLWIWPQGLYHREDAADRELTAMLESGIFQWFSGGASQQSGLAGICYRYVHWWWKGWRSMSCIVRGGLEGCVVYSAGRDGGACRVCWWEEGTVFFSCLRLRYF